MPAVQAVLGAVVLLFGRTLYWVFIAIVGFLAGVRITEILFAGQSSWVQVLVGLAAGLAGALLAIFAQRLAFAVGGFFAGAYLAVPLAEAWSAGGDPPSWMLLGGVLGAVLAALLMDWALIFLSSLVGAAAIVGALSPDPTVSLVGYVLLVLLGIWFQAWHFERRRGRRRGVVRVERHHR